MTDSKSPKSSKPQPAKPVIVSFKADESLINALHGIENRSDFIRSAVLAALENVCPLCTGRGLLTPNQKNHWESFAAAHAVTECGECHELHLICENSPRPTPHRTTRKTKAGKR